MLRKPIDRRKFMEICSVGFGSAVLFQQCSNAEASPWRFFTNDEAYLAGLICEQIIPTDEYPGAIEAGVVHFVDKQLSGPYERFQSDYRAGLQKIGTTSEKIHSRKFENLSWDQQTDILKLLDSGRAPKDIWLDNMDRRFFRLIRLHCMQGYYGSPRHGGNKNFATFL